MCGLIGYITKEASTNVTKKHSFMEQGLLINSLRGKDATGIATVTNELVHMLKKVVQGSDFVQLREFILAMKHSSIIMGHNRKGTMGGNTLNTAHPFEHGDIILEHNGTLNYYGNIRVDGYIAASDSDAIAKSFSVNGVEETVKMLEGSFALTWYDKSTKLFNVIRNKERELHYVITADKNTIFYASEGHMIHLLMHRIDIPSVSNEYQSFKSGFWYTIDPKTLDIKSKKIELHIPYVNTYKSKWPNNTSNSSHKGVQSKSISHVTGVRTNSFSTLLSKLSLRLHDKLSMYLTEVKENGMHMFMCTNTTTEKAEECVSIAHFPTQEELAMLTLCSKSLFSAEIRGCTYNTKAREYYVYVQDVMLEANNRILLEVKGEINTNIKEKEFDVLAQYGCSNCGIELNYNELSIINWTVENEPICQDCNSIVIDSTCVN